jgi:hypothetical protein
MYKVTETYEDFNGVSRTEDFFFNLTTAELTKMELDENGGLAGMLQIIVNKKDIPRLIKIFETIVDSSYGVKSPDGRKFMKSPDILEDFKSTNAYSQIFTRFATDEVFTSEFINNVIPKDLAKQVDEMQKKGENITPMQANTPSKG